MPEDLPCSHSHAGSSLLRSCTLTSGSLSKPALPGKPGCDTGLSMNLLSLCFFIYKTRLPQSCGRINNDLSNIIQPSGYVKPRIREGQPRKAGKRLRLRSSQSRPPEEAEELPGPAGGFPTAESVLGSWSIVQNTSFLQPRLCDSEEPHFFNLRETNKTRQRKRESPTFCGSCMNFTSFHETTSFQIAVAMASLSQSAGFMICVILHLANTF